MTDVAAPPRAQPRAAGHPPLGPLRRGIREAGLALIALGVVVLLFVVYELFGTNLTFDRHQRALAQAFRAEVAAAPPTTVPTSPSSLPAPGGSDASAVVLPSVPSGGGGVIAHLVIPKIGVDRYVVDGTSEADLTEGPGHYPGTPYPGQAGDVAIAGHRTTYGAPFYRLGSLAVGDDIYLTDTAGHTFRYQVDQPSLVVAPSDVAVIGPTPDATLTLTTCNPPLSATSRLIVKAKLVGLPVVAPPVPATAAPTPTAHSPAVGVAARPNLTGGASSAWAPAVGWGLAAVLAWVATRVVIARTRRWRRIGCGVAALAVCGVALWFTFAQVIRLLPQSI